MPITQAHILLRPSGVPDDLPYRSLKFKSNADQIDIGRASKRENKNLAPAQNNGLFDSRVMSRIHATMSASLEKKAVYIRDPGSMHGTWINDTKIPVDENVELANGDVLKFGVEVVRGTDTYPPLAVRFECKWLEQPYVADTEADGDFADPVDSDMEVQQPNQTTNTFCVPDDDDDGEPIRDSVPTKMALDHSSEQNESAESSDSDDNHSVMIVSSVLTSPVRIEYTMGDSSTKSNESSRSGSQQNPIDLGENSEQPLAAPRMTPPSPTDTPGDLDEEVQYYAEYLSRSSDEESVSESENWEEDDEAEEEDIDEQDEEEDIPYLEIELDSISPEAEAEGPDQILSNTALPKPVEVMAPAVECETQNTSSERPATEGCDTRKAAHHSSINQPHPCELPPMNSGVTSALIPNHLEHLASTNTSCPEKPSQLPWSLPDKPSANSSLPLHPGAKLFDHPLAAFTSPYTPGPPYGPYEMMPFQDPCTSHTTYNDGPFVSSYRVMPAKGLSACKSSSTSDLQPIPFMDPLTPLLPRMNHTPATGSGTTPSILNADSRPLKRKATEMDTEPLNSDLPRAGFYNLPPIEAPSSCMKDTSQQPVEDSSSMPDAQPQSLAAILNSSDSQLTTLSLPKNDLPKESPKDTSQQADRPVKRLKTSNKPSLRSHAATAILGAVVGAVGTIAALAALPPDYFV